MEQEYEFVPGSPEQIEVFLDLQRMIVKMYNKWPGDTGIAVYAAALGCVTALIEAEFKRHLDECPDCKEMYPKATLDLKQAARDNFDHYYSLEHERAIIDAQAAKDIVDNFFKKGEH
jgi:hypothetical protein